jgi:ribosomal protein S12 methylthiotransferase accessory factor
LTAFLGDVPAVPAFAARLHVQPIAGEGVAFIGESGGVFLDDPVVSQVTGLIDGRRSSSAIAAALAPHVAQEDVLNALRSLTQSRVIGESADVPAGLAALWSEFGVDELRLRSLLQATQLGVIPLTDDGHAELSLALMRLGLTVGGGVDRMLDVVLVEDYLDPRLAQVNDQALAQRRPWLPVKASGVNIWVGPVFLPWESACWQCLEVRLRQNRPIER